MLKEWRWRIVRRSDTKNLSIAEIHVSESGFANAHRVCEYGLENRLQLAGRTRDDTEHLRGRRLMLQCLGQLALALFELLFQLVSVCLEVWLRSLGLAATGSTHSRLRSGRTKLA